jgi:hypothetical protein
VPLNTLDADIGIAWSCSTAGSIRTDFVALIGMAWPCSTTGESGIS